ncbi:hypothetical protein [Alkalicoccobacillus murimartini]|uniref:Glycosyl hydrolase n=1 Tax=Alkalicoccobacillus murimartini TaxID=171685 RepID=A0ABT9YG64_9BACI|nr:hypothetical protein [Alkalicoccobacillus murimartini]MDQ0206054.1 hypothetical protein [Alkalicoccobacillus murimartini]
MQNINNTVVSTVEDYYRDENGLIANYPGSGQKEYLSESIGLYMQYLVLSNEEEAFEKEYQRLKTYVREVNSDKFLQWKVEEGITVNALIDDVRIAYVLDLAGVQFENKAYSELSSSIQDALIEHQYKEGYWHDFYDWQSPSLSNQVHFSYFSSLAWNSFGWNGNGLEILNMAQDTENVFYFEMYDIEGQKPGYYNAQQVNMIDQILIMSQLDSLNEEQQTLETWLVETYNKNERLVGRYDRNTGTEAVDYEAPAVYALLIIHFLNKKDVESAKKWEGPLKSIYDAEAPNNDTHFFDYMLSSIALEWLEKESH